jgi:16S rRNA (uracil1498-N3)-methyltransferase
MHRFYIPPEDSTQPVLTLTHAEAHHALHVVRLRRNELVAVLDGAGNELICQIAEAGRRQLSLKVIQRRSLPPSPHRITLAQAITKGKTMDLIVQKATELGVHHLAPIICERSVPQSVEGTASAKQEKWRAAAIEAIKQCGSPWLPEISAPQTVGHFLANAGPFELSLVASLREDARHPREFFEAFLAEHDRLPGSVCLWIGPEGDFAPGEIDAICRAGVRPVTLGKLVLRSDTAAVSLLSVTNYELEAPRRSRAGLTLSASSAENPRVA